MLEPQRPTRLTRLGQPPYLKCGGLNIDQKPIDLDYSLKTSYFQWNKTVWIVIRVTS